MLPRGVIQVLRDAGFGELRGKPTRRHGKSTTRHDKSTRRHGKSTRRRNDLKGNASNESFCPRFTFILTRPRLESFLPAGYGNSIVRSRRGTLSRFHEAFNFEKYSSKNYWDLPCFSNLGKGPGNEVGSFRPPMFPRFSGRAWPRGLLYYGESQVWNRVWRIAYFGLKQGKGFHWLGGTPTPSLLPLFLPGITGACQVINPWHTH